MKKFFFLLTCTVVMLLGLLPVAAQDAAPGVLILPIDRAQFLPGALFDVRVEVHTETLPDNFTISVNGVNAPDFFGAAPTRDTWQFGNPPRASQAFTWRGVSAPEPGEYEIVVRAGETRATANWTVREAGTGTARNVILFVADGLTIPILTAARVASVGVTQGTYEGEFAVDNMDYIGLAHTSSIDSLMADSANTASAINTGHIASVNATGSYSDTSPDRLDDPRVETFAEMIRRLRGMSVGIVTTADWTDATPAAVFAHGRDRSANNRSNYAIQALEGTQYEAELNAFGVVQPDVIFGGGIQFMLPQGTDGSVRTDTRDMVAEFEAAGYATVSTATELRAMLENLPQRALGLFHRADMNTWLDRNVYTGNVGGYPDQPGLVEMTVAALEILNQNPNGFFLEVEAASIDKQMHRLDQERALSDVIEFDQAIGATIAWVQENAPDTLIVVTSDHGHGYEVYGTVNVEQFNAAADENGRNAAIRVYAAAGYPTYTDEDGDGFPNWDTDVVFAGLVNNHGEYTDDFQVSSAMLAPTIIDVNGEAIDNPEADPHGILLPNVLSPGAVNAVHTLQDVPVFASGPGADFFGGVYHQREIFFGMAAAVGLNPSEEGD